MEEMAWVSDKSIVPMPEANLSTELLEIHSEMFPANRQRDQHGENITSFTEVMKPQLWIK